MHLHTKARTPHGTGVCRFMRDCDSSHYYFTVISSTLIFRKTTLEYCMLSASKWGATILHGPHLRTGKFRVGAECKYFMSDLPRGKEIHNNQLFPSFAQFRCKLLVRSKMLHNHVDPFRSSQETDISRQKYCRIKTKTKGRGKWKEHQDKIGHRWFN